MDRQHQSTNPLSSALRAVAEDEERLATSSAVGMRLLAEVETIARTRRRRRTVLSLAAAAAVLMGTGAAWRTTLLDRRGAQPPSGTPVVTRELVTEFFPLAYSNVPARGGYVLRMQVPRETLASFGAAAPGEGSGQPTVLADVVIGDDGLARAVRFVQVIRGDQQEQAP